MNNELYNIFLNNVRDITKLLLTNVKIRDFKNIRYNNNYKVSELINLK